MKGIKGDQEEQTLQSAREFAAKLERIAVVQGTPAAGSVAIAMIIGATMFLDATFGHEKASEILGATHGVVALRDDLRSTG